jgi:hypothetical protein
MRWLKQYEDFKYEEVSYNPFYNYSNGKDGYIKGQHYLKPSIKETITNYNNILQHLGIVFKMPAISSDGLYIDLIVNLLQVQLPSNGSTNPIEYTRTVFYNILQYFYKTMEESKTVLGTVRPMVDNLRDLSTIRFSFDHKETKDSDIIRTNSRDSNNRTKESIKFIINRDLTNEKNFMEKMLYELDNYLLEHLTNKIVFIWSSRSGVGDEVEELELNFIKNTILISLKQIRNNVSFNTDNISKIAFEEIRNSKDSHAILNYLKTQQDSDNMVARNVNKNWGTEMPIDWYEQFKKLDKDGVDKSIGMNDMGFSD